MFAVGSIQIGNFNLWVTTPVFTKPELTWSHNLPYYEVSLTERDQFYPYYINLHKNKLINFIDFSKPDSNTDLTELNAFLERKEFNMPLWKLSKATIVKLIDLLIELNNQNKSLLTR